MDREALHRFLYDMLLARAFEERAAQEYSDGNIAGFLHLYPGEEAVAVGVIHAAEPSDYLVTTYREHVHALVRGISPRQVMAELFAKEGGVCKGRGGSMHIFDVEHRFMGGYALVGGPFPLAVGIAKGLKMKGGDEISICFLGDAANNQGTFHESLNMAKIWDLPVLYVCENNLYGIGTRIDRSTAVQDQYKRVAAYDIPAEQVDGQDVEVVYAAAKKAIEHVRSGKGPYFLELMTYRYRGHSMSDAKTYRTKEEEAEWEKRDPIKIYGARLKEAGLVTDADIKAMEKEIDNEIENDIVKFAEESPEPPVEELTRYVLDDDPDPRWIGPLVSEGE